MTSLQTAEKSRKTPSHEARLGILVITILVFAFGFLVYHKMDMHQRRLTEAAINPGVPASSTQNAGDATFAEFTASSGATETTSGDPLIQATQLSDGSPFADGAVGETGAEFANAGGSTTSGQTETFIAMNEPVSADPGFAEAPPTNSFSGSETETAENTSGSKSTADVPEFQFSEPSEPSATEATEPVQQTPATSTTDVQGEAFPEPVIELPSETTVATTETDVRGDAPALQFTPSDDSKETEQPATLGEQTPTLVPQSEENPFGAEPVITAESGASAAPAAAAPEENPFGSESTPRIEPKAETPEPVMELPAEQPQDAFAKSDSDVAMPRLETGNTVADSNQAFEEPAESAAAKTDNVTPFPAIADNAFAEEQEPAKTETTTQEPVLIAMADPQEGSPFSGGFAPDEDSQPATKAPAAEPVFEKPSFGQSSGFNAVTNPSGKSKNQVVRNAAGSGADGKFSLAAFNYQNEAVQSAPDDGSTYDSVVVQQGDNYSKISKRVYGTVRYFSALAVFNQHRISDPKKMRPGMIVLTPEASVLEERYPQLFIDSKPKVAEPAGFLVMDDGSPAYRVGERETLSQISERFLGRSARWVEIYRLNQSVVTDPNKLKAGIILALPEDATEVNITP